MTSLEALSTTLERLVDAGEVGGWVVGVADPDDPSARTSDPGADPPGQSVRCGGRRSPDGPPMSSDTQFALSSSTKPLGAALALRLVELGVVDLDEAVDPWLPELASPRVLVSPEADLTATVPAQRPITLRHLLTMTPGFGWVSEPGPLAIAITEHQLEPGPFGPPMPADEFMARLGSLPLADQPGTAWRYHTSSDVLGVLLARAGGASLSDLLVEHLLRPLGMTTTGFVGDPALMATALAADAGRLTPFPVPPGTFTQPPLFASLAAGLVATVPDQLTFLRSLVGGPGVLSARTLAAMRTDHLTDGQRRSAGGFLGDDCGWGLGLEIRANGLIGWAGGLGTIGYADPRTGRAAFLATQTTFDAPGTATAFEAFWTLFG